MSISDLLTEEMKKRNWSQSDLARESGVSRQTINYLLSGRSKTPDHDTVTKLSRAFYVPSEVFYRSAGVLPEDDGGDDWLLRVQAKLKNVHEDDRPLAESIIDLFAKRNRDIGSGKAKRK